MRREKKYKSKLMGWISLPQDDVAHFDAGEDQQRDLKARENRKGKVGRFPVRTFYYEDELDKSELMLKQPIRKKDVVGGRKMVFYQYRPELYNPQGTNFAGRRKSDHTSKYRGVYWNKNHKKWEIKVKIAGKTLSLGFEHSEEAAARKYDRFITKFVINRLAINFPEDIGGVKLSIEDLITAGEETLEEATEKLQRRVEKKNQDLMLDFGLDAPDEVSGGCQEWPSSNVDHAPPVDGEDEE